MRPTRRTRIEIRLLGVPVFVKVLGIAVGVAVLLGGGMLWQIHQTWHAHLVGEIEQRGRVFAAEVAVRAGGVLRAGGMRDLAGELRQEMSGMPDAAYMVLEDANGRIVAEARAQPEPDSRGRIREVTAGVGDGAGRLRVGMCLARVEHEVAWLTARVARTTAVMVCLGILAAWWLTRLFTKPIEELVSLTRAVKGGHYASRARVRCRDEVGELAAAFNEMTEALARKEAARQRLLQKVIGAGEEERKRIARELHDQTGQALTSQIAGLSALEGQTTPGNRRQRLAELREQAERTLADVHALSVALRPSLLDDVGLMAALQRHCRLVAQRFDCDVACSDAGLDGARLPPDVELTVYRIVQEALTNAVRHGGAKRVETLIRRLPRRVTASIRDDGCGFDARDWRSWCLAGDHLGLLGLEERVTLLGGTLFVDSTPGHGATLSVEIPLKEPS